MLFQNYMKQNLFTLILDSSYCNKRAKEFHTQEKTASGPYYKIEIMGNFKLEPIIQTYHLNT
jgi:hypothetical protein